MLCSMKLKYLDFWRVNSNSVNFVRNDFQTGIAGSGSLSKRPETAASSQRSPTSERGGSVLIVTDDISIGHGLHGKGVKSTS